MNGFLAWLNANRVELIIILAILIIFFALRTKSTDITFAEVIEPGETTVVEVFSNTCTACLLSKPVVNRIEAELEGVARVVRLNASSEEGRLAALTYGIRAVPTLIILNECGEVVSRVVGMPNPSEVVALVTSLPACR